MKSFLNIAFLLILAAVVAESCKKRDDDTNCSDGGTNPTTSNATPYDFVIPRGFPQNANVNPPDNPMTVEGVALGRKLFYDERLSADNSMSCASCHNQANAFTDNNLRFSVGIDGIAGTKNAMQIVNLAWSDRFFWDGRRESLEDQAFDPVNDPIEMHDTWPNVENKLRQDLEYPSLFKAAFGTDFIDSVRVARAIAQFERSLVSSNSRFDKKQRGEIEFTPLEAQGELLFSRDRVVDSNGVVIIRGADCFHCHTGSSNLLLTTNEFHNNGLDLLPDSGLARVTKNPADFGQFRTPTLRNLSYTAPYMHDGRFETLEEVIDFYSEEIQRSINLDPLMKNVNSGGVRLTEQEKQALIAFLKTFDDEDFITNPEFSDPDL